MKPVLVLYGTRQGQARRVAERLGEMLAARHCKVVLEDAARVPISYAVHDVGAIVVVASVHMGRHEPEVAAFIKQQRAAIHAMPSAFVSVSLSQATADNPTATSDQRRKGAADAQAMIQTFLEQTGWRPDRVQPVAGALRYSRYNWALRFVMKWIASKAAGPVDASRDYEYTDWSGLERFADELVGLFADSVAQTD